MDSKKFIRVFLVIFVVSIITIVFSVNGALNTNIVFHYNNSNTTQDSSDNGNHSTITGSLWNTGGISGNAFGSVGLGNYQEWSSNLPLVVATSNFTINMWFKTNSTTDFQYVFSAENGGNGKGFGVFISNPATLVFRHFDTGVDVTCNTSIVTHRWYMVTYIRQIVNPKSTLFLNGVSCATTNTDYLDGITLRRIFQATGGPFQGAIDEVTGWKRPLNSTEILLIYDDGNYCNPVLNPNGCDEPSAEPSLDLSTNLTSNTNYTFNIGFNFSGVVEDTTDLMNCSLAYNGKINQTWNNINVSNSKSVLLNYCHEQRAYNLSLHCNNTIVSDTETYQNIFLDCVLPEIELDILTSFVNGSNFIKDMSVITINVTYSDANLYYYNRTIFNLLGVVVENSANILTPSTYNDYSQRIPNATGNYTLRLEAWDSHTGNTVRALNSMAESGFIISGYRELKLKRDIEQEYYFEVTFNENANSHVLYIKGGDYIPYSTYPGHFVNINTSRWIDFYSDSYYDLEVYNVADGYELRFNFPQKINKILFKGIGDLNYLKKEYKYSVISMESAILQDMYSDQVETSEGINMIWIVLLYSALIYFGISLFTNMQYLPGWIMLFITTGFDFVFMNEIYDTYLISLLGPTDLNNWIFLFFVMVFPMIKLLGMFMVLSKIALRGRLIK